MSAADIDAALGDAARVLLDGSTLIAFHSRLETAHELARHLLGRIEESTDPVYGFFSVITASELLIRPIRAGAIPFTFMHTFLTTFPNLTPLPVDLTVAVEAATLRATSGIRLPDAVVVASGLLAGCEAIVSNDEQWKRRLEPLFSDFRWLCLSDYV